MTTTSSGPKVTVSIQQETSEMHQQRMRTNTIASLIEGSAEFLKEKGVEVVECAVFTAQSVQLFVDDATRFSSTFKLDREIPLGEHRVKLYKNQQNEELFYEVQCSTEKITSGSFATQFFRSYGGSFFEYEYVGVLVSSGKIAISSTPNSVQVELATTKEKNFYTLFWMQSGNNVRSLIIDPMTFESLPADELRKAQLQYVSTQDQSSLSTYLTEIKKFAEKLGSIEPSTRISGHLYLLSQAVPFEQLLALIKEKFSAEQYIQILKVYQDVFSHQLIMKKKDTTQLEATLSELSKVDAGNKHIYAVQLAYAFAKKGDVDKIFPLLQPYLTPGKYQLSMLLINNIATCASAIFKKNKEQAYLLYKFCVESEPENHVYNYMTGYVLGDQDKFAEAVPFFEKALAKKPNDYDYLLTYGYSLIELKRYDDAQKVYEKVIEHHPQKAHIAYFNLADMYHEVSQDDKAWEYIQKARELKPDMDVIAELYTKLEKRKK